MKRSSLLLVIGLCLTSAVFAQKSSDVRTPGSFKAINLGGGFSKLILKAGDKESVELIADSGDLSKVETEVNGKTLEIGMKKGRNNWNNHQDITVVVTYRSLVELNMSGSTNVEVEGTLKGDKFEFNASGSGNLTGSFDVANLEINIAGSANAKLSGKATDQHYAISGSGNVDASSLNGQTAEVAISGSGDVALNVDGKVRSSVSGSGDVTNKRNK